MAYACDGSVMVVHENVQCCGGVACVHLEEVRLCDVYVELRSDGCVCEFIACVDFMPMSEEAGVSCMSCQE